MTYPALIITIVIALFANGCASLTSRQQVAAFDSSLRGIDIYEIEEDKSKQIGRTPTMAPIKNRREKTFHLRIPETDFKKVETVQCPINWTSGVGGNAVLAAPFFAGGPVVAGIVAMAGFLAIDGWTGEMFNCEGPHYFTINPSGQESEKAKPCHIFMVMPSPSANSLVSARIASEWQKNLKMPEGSCDRFVDASAASMALDYLDIDYLKPKAFERINKSSRQYIGYTTGANHLVYLESIPTGDGLSVEPVVFDLITGNEVNTELLGWEQVDKNRAPIPPPMTRSEWAYMKTLNYLPNAIGFGTAVVSVRNDYVINDRLQQWSEKKIQTLPRALTGFSLFTVQHPSGYSDWDYVFSVSPRVIAFSLDYDYEFIDPRTRAIEEYKLRGFVAAGFYEAGMTLHTPIGAFGMGVGVGPAIGYIRDNQSRPKTRVAPAANAHFDWVVFMSQNTFVTVGNDFVMFDPNSMETRKFRLQGFNQTYLALGYFIPTVNRWLRDL